MTFTYDGKDLLFDGILLKEGIFSGMNATNPLDRKLHEAYNGLLAQTANQYNWPKFIIDHVWFWRENRMVMDTIIGCLKWNNKTVATYTDDMEGMVYTWTYK